MNFPYLNEFGAINTYAVPELKTSYTITAANQGQILLCSPSADITINIPIGLPKNFYCAVLKVNDAANVILDPASGVILSSATEENGNSTITVDFQFVELVMWGDNRFVASGFGAAGIDLTAALAGKQDKPQFGWLTNAQTVSDDEPTPITGLTVNLLANTYYDVSIWLEATAGSDRINFTNGGDAVFSGSILSLFVDGANLTSAIVPDFAYTELVNDQAVQFTGRIKVTTSGTIQMRMVNANPGTPAITKAGSNIVCTPVGTF